MYDNLAIIRFDDKDRYFIDEMCKVTSVTQTRKKWGRHIYWLSHKQYQSIRTKECKVGCEFEIKTDNSTGLSTLPESIHRDDPNFHYQSIGRDVILVQDGLYDGLVKELTDSLRQNSDRNVGDNSENYDHDNIAIINNNNRISLAEPDISDMIAHLGHFYQNGIRDEFVYGLSVYLYKKRVKLENAEKIIGLLCQTTNDEEHKNRITVLHNTYHSIF